MRLSDVLSKPITTDYVQIEGFLGSRKLKTGNSKKIAVGKVALNYYCNNCGDQRTFYSGKDLFCIGVTKRLSALTVFLNALVAVLLCKCGSCLSAERKIIYIVNILMCVLQKEAKNFLKQFR